MRLCEQNAIARFKALDIEYQKLQAERDAYRMVAARWLSRLLKKRRSLVSAKLDTKVMAELRAIQ